MSQLSPKIDFGNDMYNVAKGLTMLDRGHRLLLRLLKPDKHIFAMRKDAYQMVRVKNTSSIHKNMLKDFF